MATRYFLGLFLAALLTGCGGDNSNTADNADGGTTPAQTPTQSTSPSIIGSPASTVAVGATYSFAPSASGTSGSELSFSIQNKPDWATFNAATGALIGKPTTAELGKYSGIVIAVSDGTANAELSAFSITVVAASTTVATDLTISGSPLNSVLAGASYIFTPTSAGADGKALTFAIQNKPSWAVFDASSGELSGAPAAGDIGSTPGIVISVSDGTQSASLPAFSLAVVQSTNNTATLSWTPPTENTDGTALLNLAGYRVYYGATAQTMSKEIQIANPGASTYIVTNLTAGTWFFSVKSYTAANVESNFSTAVSKAIL